MRTSKTTSIAGGHLKQRSLQADTIRRLKNNTMRETTRKRYERIRQAAAHMYGTMPVMQLYACLAADFDLSEEAVRKILAKKRPP
jgi:hypothetical protein